jgi:hypothetical protein
VRSGAARLQHAGRNGTRGVGDQGDRGLFSKRAEESVRSPRRLEVRRIVVALKVATSSSSAVAPVFDLRVVAAHDAGEGDGRLAGADEQIRFARPPPRCRRASGSTRPFAPGARRCRDRRRGSRAGGVEDVVRLPEVEHHEVRDVDEQIDRALAHREQQVPQPQSGERAADTPSITSPTYRRQSVGDSRRTGQAAPPSGRRRRSRSSGPSAAGS